MPISDDALGFIWPWDLLLNAPITIFHNSTKPPGTQKHQGFGEFYYPLKPCFKTRIKPTDTCLGALGTTKRRLLALPVELKKSFFYPQPGLWRILLPVEARLQNPHKTNKRALVHQTLLKGGYWLPVELKSPFFYPQPKCGSPMPFFLVAVNAAAKPVRASVSYTDIAS